MNNNNLGRGPIIQAEELGATYDDPNIAYSTWLLTVQTHRVPANAMERQMLKDAMREAIVGEAGMRNNLPLIIEFHNDHLAARMARNPLFVPKEDYTQDTVDDLIHVNFTYVFETNPRNKKNGGRFHAHILVKITHTSNIRLNHEAIKEIFLDHLTPVGVNGIYLNIRSMNSSHENALRYMKKGDREAVVTDTIADEELSITEEEEDNEDF